MDGVVFEVKAGGGATRHRPAGNGKQTGVDQANLQMNRGSKGWAEIFQHVFRM